MDKVIIITGGAGGIGSDICRGLAADGFKIVVADYAKDAAEKTAAEIRNAKGDATAIEVDVGSKESVAEMMKQALAKYGQVDILFNGAGVMTRIPVVDMPEEEWDRVLRINLKGNLSLLPSSGETYDSEESRDAFLASPPAEASRGKRARRIMRRPKPASSPLLNPWQLSWHPTILPSTPSAPAPPIRRCPERVRQPKNSKKERKSLRYWMG